MKDYIVIIKCDKYTAIVNVYDFYINKSKLLFNVFSYFNISIKKIEITEESLILNVQCKSAIRIIDNLAQVINFSAATWEVYNEDKLVGDITKTNIHININNYEKTTN